MGYNAVWMNIRIAKNGSHKVHYYLKSGCADISTSTFEYCRILFGILFSLCLFCGGSFLCGSLGGSGRSLGLGTATT